MIGPAGDLLKRLGLRTGEQLPVAPQHRFAPYAGHSFWPLLTRGGVHEWFLLGDNDLPLASASPTTTEPPTTGPPAPRAAARNLRRHWLPPLTLLALLAARGGEGKPVGKFLWVGRSCWPTFQLLCAALGEGGRALSPDELLDRCVFVDPPKEEDRFWAIGEALRCASLRAVVADGSRMGEAVSRRLQLAAESSGVMALLARPPWERAEASWAMTRWDVRPRWSPTLQPRWEVELVRRKGWDAAQAGPHRWVVDWEYRSFMGECEVRVEAMEEGSGGRKETARSA